MRWGPQLSRRPECLRHSLTKQTELSRNGNDGSAISKDILAQRGPLMVMDRAPWAESHRLYQWPGLRDECYPNSWMAQVVTTRVHEMTPWRLKMNGVGLSGRGSPVLSLLVTHEATAAPARGALLSADSGTYPGAEVQHEEGDPYVSPLHAPLRVHCVLSLVTWSVCRGWWSGRQRGW